MKCAAAEEIFFFVCWEHQNREEEQRERERERERDGTCPKVFLYVYVGIRICLYFIRVSSYLCIIITCILIVFTYIHTYIL